MSAVGPRFELNPFLRTESPFRSLLPVFLKAMKKYLPALAVLALAGCAHSQYRTTYLEEYAGHDCIELQAVRLTVEAELDPRWRQGYSSRNTADSVQSFAGTHAEPPYTIYDVYPASMT